MKKTLTLFLVSLATASLISVAMAQQPDNGGQQGGQPQGGQQGGQRQNRQGQGQGMNRQMGGMNRQPSAPTIKLGTTGVFVVQASGVMKLDPSNLKPLGQVALLPADVAGAPNPQRVPGPGDPPAAPAGGMAMMMSASCELGANDALYCVVGPYYVHIDGTTMKDVAHFPLYAVPAPQQNADPQNPQAQSQQMMQMMTMMQPSQLQLKGDRLLVSSGGHVVLVDTTNDKILASFPEAPAP